MNKTFSDYVFLPIPPIPNTQALSSTTFRPPPLDGSLNLPEICEWNSVNNPEHAIFVHTDDDRKEHVILWPTLVQAMHNVAYLVQSSVLSDENDSVGSRTIAILASGDSITYLTTILGILQSGNVVFPISTRNSATAVAHLLRETRADFLLVGKDHTHQVLATSALQLLDTRKPEVRPMFVFEDIYGSENICKASQVNNSAPFKASISMHSPAMILHSSGSTAFPKPVPWSHYGLVQQCIAPYFGEVDLTGLRLGCHALPAFHAMCIVHLCFSAGTGLVISVFGPMKSAAYSTAGNIMKEILDTKCDMVVTVPSFVESWSRNEEDVAGLKTLLAVMTAGGPLERSIGDDLRDKGVRLYNVYGCTEGVVCIQYIWKTPCHEWEYLPLSKAMDLRLVPQNEGLFELVIKPGPYAVPFVFNTTIEGQRAYATGDLFETHPTKTGFYKLYGRLDDQIMHSTGEKTNPVPLERIINQDPHVQSVVMFGRGKFNAGILINPASSEKVDPSNDKSLSAFRDKIWPTIEKVNEYAPQHSRIFKEMILVAKKEKPFTFTAKGTARRQAVINDYADEISELYATVESHLQSEISPPVAWTEEELLAFVRDVVNRVISNKSLGDEDDLFVHGCDSLQAVWIRITLLNTLRDLPHVETRRVPMNFVYSHPTISALAHYLFQHGSHRNMEVEGDVVAKVDEMLAMVAKHSQGFQAREHVNATGTASTIDTGATKATVVLTGSTGGLGSVLLQKLLEEESVVAVYALNRRGSGNPMQRQADSFSARGIDTDILSSPKLTMLEVDFENQMLGLESDLYGTIRDSVTNIIHNAYTVNFNMSLQSFEPNVRGLRRLVDFALSSPRPNPPRFLFTSSIGTLRYYERGERILEQSVEPRCAVGSGYSESKWVCEAILARAAAETALRPTTVRVGQLSGMSTNGYWNPKEWVPSLIKSSMRMGCIPNIESDVSWIPVDTAAQVLVEMMASEEPVLHLVHAHPVTWSSLFEPMGEVLGLKMVSYEEWLETLEAVSANVASENGDMLRTDEGNPALKIIDFFRSLRDTPHSSRLSSDSDFAGTAMEVMGSKRMSLQKALECSVSLNTCSPLSVDDAMKWMKGWKLIS